MSARSDGLTLEIKRLLPAAPAVVFAALSDASELARWWGPNGFTTPSLDFDPRVGREIPDRDAAAGGDHFYLTGEFRAVDPPASLAYTFVWAEPIRTTWRPRFALFCRDLGESTGSA